MTLGYSHTDVLVFQFLIISLLKLFMRISMTSFPYNRDEAPVTAH
jgi:hypothetical protein